MSYENQSKPVNEAMLNILFLDFAKNDIKKNQKLIFHDIYDKNVFIKKMLKYSIISGIITVGLGVCISIFIKSTLPYFILCIVSMFIASLVCKDNRSKYNNRVYIKIYETCFEGYANYYAPGIRDQGMLNEVFFVISDISDIYINNDILTIEIQNCVKCEFRGLGHQQYVYDILTKQHK